MKETDIRPEGIFKEYLKLCEKDSKKFFSSAKTEKINCPACDSRGKKVIEKNGFSYDECPVCRTLYVNPRPSALSFKDFYEN